jgi:hypothetical protein
MIDLTALPRPAVDSPQLRELCGRIVPGEVPVLVPHKRMADMVENDCFINVPKVVEQYGGRIEHGWQLWENPRGLMIEAEFHAVYLHQNGQRFDITPKSLPFEGNNIAFLPDPSRVWEGKQVNNVRMSLVDDPLMDEFIAAADAWFEARNEGDLATYHGDDAAKLGTPRIMQAQRKMMDLQMRLATKYCA